MILLAGWRGSFFCISSCYSDLDYFILCSTTGYRSFYSSVSGSFYDKPAKEDTLFLADYRSFGEPSGVYFSECGWNTNYGFY